MARMNFVNRGRALAAALSLACTGSGALAAAPAPGVEVYAGCEQPPATEGRIVAVDTPQRLAQAIRAARPGEVISLGDGAFGRVNIVGDPGGFVTLTAARGAHPVLESLGVGGHTPTGHWIIRGLTVSGLGEGGVDGHGWPKHSRKLSIDEATDVIVEGNLIQSVAGDYPWRPDTQGVAAENPLAEGVAVENSTCVAVLRNHIHNVFDGIVLDGDQIDRRGADYLVEDNEVDQFSGDGIDESGSHVLIRGNRITNGHNTCRDICIHNDGIQGWTHWDDPKITNTDVTIDGNTIIVSTTPDLPLMADDLHGITIFDGRWDGVNVVNNVVLTDAWHGITLFGVVHGVIANNTVVGANSARKTWIEVGPAKPNYGRSNSDQVVIRNNIAPAVNVDRRGEGPAQVTVDHNLVDADPRRLFVAVDPPTWRFDLHLRPDSEALGKGSADLAPPTDADRKPRSGRIDVGAYAGAE
jgi:hypothetical protein